MNRRCLLIVLVIVATTTYASDRKGAKPAVLAPPTSLSQFVSAIREKAKLLESSSGMRLGFQSFTSAYKIAPASVSYSDYVLARLFYEAARDAGFWNVHWTITNMPPNSDKIWGQWKSVRKPSFLTPTASAECDELSALYAFLLGRAGVRGVGLFWPYPNHTVAVWVLHPANGKVV